MQYVEIVFNLPVKKTFIYSVPENVAPGCRVIAPFGSRKLTGCVISVQENADNSKFKIKEVYSVIDEKPLIENELLELSRWMARVYMCSPGEALFTILPGGQKEKEVSEDILNIEENVNNFKLSKYQKNAIYQITSSAEDNVYYVHGVTGSGKTEVFLKSAESFVKKNKDVIYLVPEISLVYQTVEYFRRIFKENITVLHSGLTSSKKLNAWRKIQNSKGNVIIGVRSAVFAPVSNLGLIVIDEEHENTYKSNSTPRYHARQIAACRCKSSGAVLVMGSATPSLDAYYRINTGEITKLELPERIGEGSIPEMKIVDMKKETGIFSNELIKAVKDTYREKRQTILFLNRRGFAYLFFCKSCGYEMKCKNCSVSLTYHKNKNIMVCHYCGYRIKPVNICPDCGSLDIGYSGFGTEKIEEDIKMLFPELSVRRIDTDTVRNKNKLKGLLDKFKNREIDLLLGTQMVSKGLNFPGVKLVGIIQADLGLQLPDFKALERTFSLIMQVSGRAGRITKDGLVIVQTYKPQSEVIKMACRMELEDFYKREMSVRKALRFPPFVRIIRIVFRGRKKNKTYNAIEQFADKFKKYSIDRIELLGPVECPISVISNNYRFHIVFRSDNFLRMHSIVLKIIDKYVPVKDIYLEVDVDPVSLL